MTKPCTACGKEKPSKDFYKGNCKYGLASRCIVCTKAAAREARAAVRDRQAPVLGIKPGSTWAYRGTTFVVSHVTTGVGCTRAVYYVGSKPRTVPIRFLLREGRRVDEAAEEGNCVS